MSILGRTATRGTPIGLDRRFVEADLRIATGLVEPHFMAGWSGGRKVIAPGVAHHETIRTFHSARFMEDPLAVQCNLVGNPLHEEQLEIVRRLGDVYALNTVIDEDRDLVHVTFGEVIDSHLAAVDFVTASRQVPGAARFKTIVTSSAGYPLDKTYYQTVKGMVTPLDILEPGGTLIIASECSEGFGSPEFRDAQPRLVAMGPERFLATLTAKSLAEIDEWQTEMQLKPLRLGKVELFTTGLTAEERRITGVDIAGSVDAAIARGDRAPRRRRTSRSCPKVPTWCPSMPPAAAARTSTSTLSAAWRATCSSRPCWTPCRTWATACWRMLAAVLPAAAGAPKLGKSVRAMRPAGLALLAGATGAAARPHAAASQLRGMVAASRPPGCRAGTAAHAHARS